MKNERTWILRGTIRKLEPVNVPRGITNAFLVLELDSFQSGNAGAYRYEKAKPWLKIDYFDDVAVKDSSQPFYLGQNLIVWIHETQDENGNRAFSLKRIAEKSAAIVPVENFLQNCF